MSIYDQYETVIGLEIHVQLNTASKAFCGDDTSFGAPPNSQVSAISLAHPGTLPRLNKKQVEYAVRLGLALGSKINLESRFDRKNYFYTDLPKGYQITQDALPICVGGALAITVDRQPRNIRLHHIHMEEDAGKSIHDQAPDHTFIDLNRAGTPLLEIVSEPDLRSAAEVDAYMSAMRQLVRYLDISDGNMEQGSLRCDVNISVRKKGSEEFGTRCEVKNLNSMRFARRAIEFEVKRQIDLLESGGAVVQSTLNFNPSTGETSPLRDKENAHDYRYFPEPDLPPVVLTQAEFERIESELPALPWELRQRFQTEYQLNDYDTEILTTERDVALFFNDLCEGATDYKALANLTINKILPHLNEAQLPIDEFPLSVSALREFVALIADEKVSNSVAYQKLFPALMEQPAVAPAILAEQLDLLQSDDSDLLADIIAEVLQKNEGKVAAYRKGKKGLLGFFVGQVMRASQGKADPKRTNELLLAALEK